MLVVIISCLLLIATTTVIHYEVLSTLNARLPSLSIPNRTKLLVVIFSAFVAHFMEMVLYGVAIFVLVRYSGDGDLSGSVKFSFVNSLYFSAETYTSLGFGDLTPAGPVRLLAGAEALNGLLLIGWSASYTYIAMARFWDTSKTGRRK